MVAELLRSNSELQLAMAVLDLLSLVAPVGEWVGGSEAVPEAILVAEVAIDMNLSIHKS